MAHYAKVLNGVVTRVIVADQDFIDNLVETEPGEWIQTSYNTYGGEHLNGGTQEGKVCGAMNASLSAS